jgi:hypothetical protein
MKKATSSEAVPPSQKKSSVKRAPASLPRKQTKPDQPSPAAPTGNVTSVVAKIDVGFGNLLFVRGEGPGLSWDRGVPMECSASDLWTWSTATATRPFAYKVLVNDERWSIGDDYVASVGVENAVAPAF